MKLKRISLNITKDCNLQCKHCFTSSGNGCSDSLDKKTVFKIIDEMAEIPLLAIGGGEPLIYKDIFEVLNYAKEKGVETSIVTNSLLITEDIIEKLNKASVKIINVSIDGMKENHDYIRGEGTFEKTVEKLRLLKEKSTAKVGIESTVNKRNLNETEKVVDLAKSLGLDFIRLTPVLPWGRATEYNLSLTQEQYIEFIKKHNNEKDIELITPFKRPDLKIEREARFGCHCGRDVLWVDYNGNCHSCYFLGDMAYLGNIKTEKLADIYRKSLEKTEYKGNDICNSCSNLSVCRGGCRMRAYWKYNDINAIDYYCPMQKNRQPYQTLILPYIKGKDGYLFCILKRADFLFWQFVSGGGEYGETKKETAERELFEETGIKADVQELKSIGSVPVDNPEKHGWGKTYVIPEYAFSVELKDKKIKLSEEHLDYRWVSYEEALELLKYDTNKTALFELKKEVS